MGPIQCKSVTCPPFPNFGKTIETRCNKRDQACVTAGKYENIEDCSCHEAFSVCKPKFITSYNDTFHEVEPYRIRGLSHRSILVGRIFVAFNRSLLWPIPFYEIFSDKNLHSMSYEQSVEIDSC